MAKPIPCAFWKSCDALATNHIVEYGFCYCDEHVTSEKQKLDAFHKITSEVITSPEGFFGA